MENSKNISIDNLKVNYIFSRNRSGSTLLNNLLNQHANILSISELNVFLYLKSDYGHFTSFAPHQVLNLIDDLYFVIKKSSHEFSEFMLPNKKDLFNIIISYDVVLDFNMICKIINLHTKTGLTKKNSLEITHIIRKEISYNHLISELLDESPDTKIILLIRNHRGNVYSSLRFKGGRNNYIYEAKKWMLETRPLTNPNLPLNRLLFIHYNDLINKTEECLEHIQLFLDVPIDNELLQKQKILKKYDVIDVAKKNDIDVALANIFIKNHFGSVSNIDSNKGIEWQTKGDFTKNQLEKIDFICKSVAIPLGFECSNKKAFLSLHDRIYILLAHLDYFVATKYLSIPIRYKRIIEKLNVFEFYSNTK